MSRIPKNHNLYATSKNSGRFHKIRAFGPKWVTLELLKYGHADLIAPRFRWKPPIGTVIKLTRLEFDVGYALKRVLNV